MQAYTIKQFLNKCVREKRKFNSKREVLDAFNEENGTNFVYKAFQSSWRRNDEIDSLIEHIIKKEQTPYVPSNHLGTVKITGNTIKAQEPKPEQIIEEILKTFDAQQTVDFRRSNQKISFSEQYFVLVNMSDIHISDGVDIRRVNKDMEIIAQTPGMYLNFLGDLTDNFIGEWAHTIARNAKITPSQQLALAKHYLELIKPKLVAFTTGNHDEWSAKAAGFDILYQTLLDLQANAIYDSDENIFTVDHFGREYVVKVRHEWPGRSASNITYGIENDYRNNDFDIGVGGHTHQGGIYREFVGRNQETKVAIMCGCYKPYDNYGRQLGLKKPNKSTAVCLLFDPDSPNGFSGITDIETAANYLNLLNRYGK